MKATFLKSITCVTLLSFFAVGCGNDGGGSGGKSTSYYRNSSQLNQESQTNFNAVKSWHTSAEPTLLKSYRIHKRSITPSSGSQPCSGETKRILGIFEICIVSNPGGVPESALTTVRFLVGPNPNGNINNPKLCVTGNFNTCSENEVIYGGKSSNVKLREAISGKNNTLHLLGVTKLAPTVYQLAYSNSTLGNQPTVIYKIDTNLHSMYNPVEVIENLQTDEATQEWIDFNLQ